MYSMLRTTEEILGVPLIAGAASATSMRSTFHLETAAGHFGARDWIKLKNANYLAALEIERCGGQRSDGWPFAFLRAIRGRCEPALRHTHHM